MKPPAPDDAVPLPGDGPVDPYGPAPSAAKRFGMLLFLASLAMLFAASLVGYVVIRSDRPDGAVELPVGLWASTAALAAAAVFGHLTASAAKRLDIAATRVWLIAMGVAGFAFMGIQAPSMWALLAEHRVALAANPDNPFALYGLALTLILVHALHIVGGMVPLVMLTAKAVSGRFGLAQADNARLTVWYWHFLEVVWVVLFGVLLAGG